MPLKCTKVRAFLLLAALIMLVGCIKEKQEICPATYLKDCVALNLEYMKSRDFVEQVKLQTNQLIEKIKSLPQEKQIAYGSIALGIFFILIALIIW